MATAIRTLLCLQLAALAGGCSLAINLDDYKPGEGDDPSEKTLVPLLGDGDPAPALQGQWHSGCVSGDGVDPHANFTLIFDKDADGDRYVEFEREEATAGSCQGTLWTEYVYGAAEPIEKDALGYGDDALDIGFTLEGMTLTFLDADAVGSANDARLYGKDDWATDVEVELVASGEKDPAVDVGDSYVEGDTYHMLMVLDADDRARLSLPAGELSDHMLPGTFEFKK